MAEYLRVTPTSERLDPESIPRVLDSLHKLTTPGSSGLGAKLNPLHSETPPRFEFLAIRRVRVCGWLGRVGLVRAARAAGSA